MRILNRVVYWDEKGIHYEADQRHSEIIIKELGLDRNKKSVATPGVSNDNSKDEEEDDDELDDKASAMYRAAIARGNFLSQDRFDIKHAVKELSRRMAKPRNRDWRKGLHST